MNAPRRWFQFSLIKVFVAVTLIAFPLAWVGHQLNWIRERNAALESGQVEFNPFGFGGTVVPAPWGLRIFGEQGYDEIEINRRRDTSDAAWLRSLFPESKVAIYRDRR